MTAAEAKAVVNAYRRNIDKNIPKEYMEYMQAREVLTDLGIETMTAGQRGFMAATRQNLLGRMV